MRSNCSHEHRFSLLVVDANIRLSASDNEQPRVPVEVVERQHHPRQLMLARRGFFQTQVVGFIDGRVHVGLGHGWARVRSVEGL